MQFGWTAFEKRRDDHGWNLFIIDYLFDHSWTDDTKQLEIATKYSS